MRNYHVMALTALAASAFAQPANSNQGYRPGVTFPQQNGQQPQAAPQQPGYGLFNRNQPAAPAPVAQPQIIATPIAQPTSTPAASSSSSNSSSRSGSSSRSSSSSSRSSSNKSNSDDETPKKSTSSKKSDSDDSKSESSSSEKKNTSSEKSESKSSDSGSALDKIVKDMGKKEEAEKPAKPTPTPKPTKEELDARKKELQKVKDIDDVTTVVAKFIEAANGGDYDKANQYLSPATRKYFDSESSAIYGTRSSVLNDLTGHWSLTLATYLNIMVQGQGAQVQTELKYKDGRSVQRNFDLIKVEGEWKIDLPVTEDSIKASKSAAAATIPVETPSETPVAALTPPPAPAANPGGSLSGGIPTPEQAASIPLPLVAAPDSGTSKSE